MNMSDYLTDLEEKGQLAFFTEEAATALHKKKSYLYKQLSTFVSQGRLITPRRGLYVIIPNRHRDIGSLPAENLVLIVMNKLKIDYYACLLTAARYYGATHQKVMTFQVMTSKPIYKKWVFGRIKVDFFYKKNLNQTQTEKKTIYAEG